MRKTEFFDIDIGDEVIFIAPGYRRLVIGRVITKATKSCQIEYINDWNYPQDGGVKEVVRQSYDQIIKHVDATRDLLANEELAELFAYCARLSTMVSPRDAEHYYGFTFDGSVTDTFYGLAMLYAGEGICKTAEDFKNDELYGQVLRRMLRDIRSVIDGSVTVGGNYNES